MLMHPGTLFADAARRHGDRDAVGDGTTYHALDALVSRAAGGLSSLGLGVGDRVGMLFHNVPELVTLWLAVERAGLVRVALHSHLGIDVHADILRRTDAKALVFDTRFARAVEQAVCARAEMGAFIGVGAANSSSPRASSSL